MAHRSPPLPLMAVMLAAAAGFILPRHSSAAEPSQRTNLVQAILSEDLVEQTQLLQKMIGAEDPIVQQALTAWRGGSVYVFETNDTKVPFLMDAVTDSDGQAKGIRILDGEFLKSGDGKPLLFIATDLTPADASSKLRKAIKTTLDLFALGNPNPKMRRDAVTKLGQEQNPDYLPHFEARTKIETDKEVIQALTEAVALTQVASEDAKVRVAAIQKLGEMRSINSLSFLKQLETDAAKDPAKYGDETIKANRSAIVAIDKYMWWGSLFGTAFRGLSLSAVLLVAALGLAITFGLMGVINMAHGEMVMLGAYTTFVVQQVIRTSYPELFDWSLAIALPLAFVVTGIVGIAIERGVIRFLYGRPLETLLATWGISLILQQSIRTIFGASNREVGNPSWMSGAFQFGGLSITNNRLWIIVFSLVVFAVLLFVMKKTALGLQMRAVTQNRRMASSMGIRTPFVDAMTFGLGSGIAGLAGVALSQISNVSPNLGQTYIIDSFMVVVFGGVGNLWGTLVGAMTLGVFNKFLEPYTGAVLAKVLVLVAIILFIQKRPRGLFALKGRAVEA
jgi:urea transport system permease protein